MSHKWKYEEYSNWARLMARTKTKEQLEKEFAECEYLKDKYGKQHLRAVDKTHSMTSNSQARAQQGNNVRGNYERRMAVKNALEIHKFYPEKSKQ